MGLEVNHAMKLPYRVYRGTRGATGISAHDRAHTIKTAIDPNCTSVILQRQVIFPPVGRDGGTLVRAVPEAVIDIARAAG